MSLKNRAIRAVSSAVYRSRLLGPVAAAASHARPRLGFPILTFHRVNDDQDPFLPAIRTAVFAARIAHIARHYRVLTVEDLVERLRQGTVPRNALALTFDDGYRDNLSHAAPILAQYRLPATIFLATGYIGTPDVPWFDRVALAFKLSRRSDVTLPGCQPLELKTEGDRLAGLDRAISWLKTLPDEKRRLAVERLVADVSPRG